MNAALLVGFGLWGEVNSGRSGKGESTPHNPLPLL